MRHQTVSKKKIAKLHNVDQNCLSLGHGSNDVLESIAKAILSPDDEVLAPKYSFLVYKIVTQLMGAHYRESPVDDNFSYSSDQLLGQVTDKTKIVFIASPNNPTGFTLSFQDLYHIAESLSDKTLLVIDEAYMEYAVLYGYQSFIKRALKMKNCIVVRTFSKAYGLAGLRIGYMVAHPELIHDMEKVRQPFHVSSFAQKSAEKACEDQDFIKRTSQKIMDNKKEDRRGPKSEFLSVVL